MTAKDNRAKMPTVAKMVDEVKAVFGDGVKVLWAREGGYELGTPIDTSKLVTPNVWVETDDKAIKRRRR